MSVTRFKIGDKVRVRDDIIGCGDTCRDGVYINEKMAKIAGVIFTIDEVTNDCYSVLENDWGWNDEMLEPAEKTLDNLCAGDFVKSGDGIRKILAAVDGCYLLSYIGEYTATGSWCTVDELEEAGYSFIESDTLEPTIEIDDKKYNKAGVKKAIKDLEPIDPSDTDS